MRTLSLGNSPSPGALFSDLTALFFSLKAFTELLFIVYFPKVLSSFHMKKHYLFSLLGLLGSCLTTLPVQAQHVYTVGPMLHYNFGGNSKGQFSFGMEASYWNAFNFPYGMDLGVDFEKGRFRLYTEAQTGLIFGGISAGPYLELPKGAPAKLGLQTSVWANAFIGFDLRARFTRGETRIAPGIYAKYVGTPGGNLWEKWDENHETDGDGGDWD